MLKGIKPCLMGVILATGLHMAVSICMESDSFAVDLAACAILLVLGLGIILYKLVRKKEAPPIVLLLLAAIMGCVFYD